MILFMKFDLKLYSLNGITIQKFMMLESSQAISLRAEEMNKSELGISVIDVPTAQQLGHSSLKLPS